MAQELEHGWSNPSETMNWTQLNNRLRVADERECKRLLSSERRGKRRLIYLLRIFGRYSRLRTQRERRELAARETMKKDYRKGNWSS